MAPPTSMADMSSLGTGRPARRAASGLPPTTRSRKPHDVYLKQAQMTAVATRR